MSEIASSGFLTGPVVSSEGNQLLAALPLGVFARLQPAMEGLAFGLGDIVSEPGEEPAYVYFPTSCVVSLVYTTARGETAEMGLVGNEGAVGTALYLGGSTMPNRAVVQIAGEGLRMPATVLRKEFARGGALQRLLLRYAQALLTQISQTAVCNRLHSVEQRLCRWILLCHDRLNSNELQMTQEFIANMLGGRRQSVTMAAGRLQDAGLIQYARGRINILDRPGLETAVCECYQVVRIEFERLRRLDEHLSRSESAPVAR